MSEQQVECIGNEVKKQEPGPIVHSFFDRSVGLQAFIVIDSLWNGQSYGGLRIAEDLTLDEVKALAHVMTLKYCFSRRRLGGAKAGIILPVNCTNQQKTRILEAFGLQASFLLKTKTFVPWTDLNSSVDDIALLMKSAGCDFLGITDSSYFTALSVVSAVKAACAQKQIDLDGCTVTIEGFGAVGMNIALELLRSGMKIIGVSTVKGALYDRAGLDVYQLIELKKQYCDAFVYHSPMQPLELKEELLEMNTDVLIPCARTWCINELNVDKIQASMIIPGSNVPLTKEAEGRVHQRGVLYLPDFLCNSGGVFGTSLYDQGNTTRIVHDFIMNEFGLVLKELIQESETTSRPPSTIARAILEENCQKWYKKPQRLQKLTNERREHLQKLLSVQRYVPRVQAWFSLQQQRRIFHEYIQCIQYHRGC